MTPEQSGCDSPLISGKLAELQDRGFCVLRAHFARTTVHRCREAFWPILLNYLESHRDQPNRGPQRHHIPMPFESPCFSPEFFFNAAVLSIVRGAMDDRIVADQWGCDVPLLGSGFQDFHADYARPLFAEAPNLSLPAYMLVVSFGLVDITSAHGPIEIAPGTHRMPRDEALRAVKASRIRTEPVLLDIGDVLIRHPWALHRGTPNITASPRVLVTVRYVRRWYADDSREVNLLPRPLWQSMTVEQRGIMRFPLEM